MFYLIAHFDYGRHKDTEFKYLKGRYLKPLIEKFSKLYNFSSESQCQWHVYQGDYRCLDKEVNRLNMDWFSGRRPEFARFSALEYAAEHGKLKRVSEFELSILLKKSLSEQLKKKKQCF